MLRGLSIKVSTGLTHHSPFLFSLRPLEYLNYLLSEIYAHCYLVLLFLFFVNVSRKGAELFVLGFPYGSSLLTLYFRQAISVAEMLISFQVLLG